jgi:hypothetical protein
MLEDERSFYRKLFLQRYSLILQKVVDTYGLSPETAVQLKKRYLNLTWIDEAVDILEKRLQPK